MFGQVGRGGVFGSPTKHIYLRGWEMVRGLRGWFDPEILSMPNASALFFAPPSCHSTILTFKGKLN